MGLRVIVCGGRNFRDYGRMCRVLDALDLLHGIDVVIQGNARGADTLANRWGVERGKTVLGYPAQWEREDGTIDRGAGIKRNQQMIDQGRADACVAFPGGRGTEDMIRRARAAGLRMKVIRD